MELTGIGLILLLIIIYGIYDDSFRFRHHFSPFIAIIFISLPFSMYIADRFHNQSMSLTLYAQKGIYFYLFYFVLHQMKVKPRDFEKLFIVLGLVFVLFYMTQFLLYPKVVLFNARITHERGTIRIFLAGMEYLIIGYFLTLKNFLDKQQIKYAVLLITFLSIVILIGSRTLLFTVLAATVLNFMLSKRIRSRFLIYFLSVAGVILVYFAFQKIIEELINTAVYKDPISSQNIRVKAVKYFLARLFPNGLAYIFGNGASTGHSEYSNTVGMISLKYGYYLGDIGLIGEYIKYGSIFILGVLGLLIKVFITKIRTEHNYIKYFFVFTVMAMILGGGFSDSGFVAIVCILLYIIDVSNFSLSNSKTKTVSSDTPGSLQTINPDPE